MDETIQIWYIDHEATDEEIKEKIATNVSTEYDIVSIEESTDGVWRVNVVPANKNNEKFTLIINKDGQETKSTITISKKDQKDYGSVYRYIKDNYLPDGYHVDYEKNGICTMGSNTYKMYLKKNNANPVMITYTLEMIKCDKPFSDVNAYENATIEYHTFEYDSTEQGGILDYMTKHFLPKGYMWNVGMTIDTEVFRFTAYNLDTLEESKNHEFYTFKFIDDASNEVVGTQYQTIFGEKRKSIKSTEINYLPFGYVFDGDTFNVTEENGELVANVKVKKGNSVAPITIQFYENVGGTLKNAGTVKKNAFEMDADGNGLLEKAEVQKYLPDGYRLEYWGYYDGLRYLTEDKVCYLNDSYNFIVTKKETVHQSEESKKIATIENKDLHKVLTNSLKGGQKEKVETAIKEGKEVDFKLILKESVNDKEKKELLVYVDKLGNTKVVSAFDIEIQLFIDDKNEGTISETSSELTFKVAIPENLKKEGRKFYVLRYHDGKVDKLAVSEDGTFKTDKFSSYMLVYEDTKSEVKPEVKPDETKPEVKPDVKPETKPEAKLETKPEVKPETKPSTSVAKKENKTAKKVNTGVKNSTTFFTGLMGVSVAALGVVEVLKRKNK